MNDNEWYLDDNLDNIADYKIKYKTMISPVEGKSHTYVRSDTDGLLMPELESTLVTGQDFSNAMYKLSGNDMFTIKEVVYDKEPAEQVINSASYKVVSTPESQVEIRMCYIDNIIHIYPVDGIDKIYANSDASYMFSKDPLNDNMYLKTAQR